MVNPSRFASDPRMINLGGSTLREKLPRSVRLWYVNWRFKKRQHFHITTPTKKLLPFLLHTVLVVPLQAHHPQLIVDGVALVVVHGLEGRPHARPSARHDFASAGKTEGTELPVRVQRPKIQPPQVPQWLYIGRATAQRGQKDQLMRKK